MRYPNLAVAGGSELSGRDVNRVLEGAAGIVVDLHPRLVGQVAQFGRYSPHWGTPGSAVVGGRRHNDTKKGACLLNAARVGDVVQVIASDRIAESGGTGNQRKAFPCPSRSAIAGSIESLNAGAIVIICSGQKLHCVIRIRRKGVLVGWLGADARRLNRCECARCRAASQIRAALPYCSTGM